MIIFPFCLTINSELLPVQTQLLIHNGLLFLCLFLFEFRIHFEELIETEILQNLSQIESIIGLVFQVSRLFLIILLYSSFQHFISGLCKLLSVSLHHLFPLILFVHILLNQLVNFLYLHVSLLNCSYINLNKIITHVLILLFIFPVFIYILPIGLGVLFPCFV